MKPVRFSITDAAIYYHIRSYNPNNFRNDVLMLANEMEKMTGWLKFLGLFSYFFEVKKQRFFIFFLKVSETT